MKKILMLMLGAVVCTNVSFAAPVIYEKPDVKIIVEGEALKLDAEVPIIVNSRTLVPLRKLLVGLGVPDNTENIKWIGENREVKVDYNGVKIDLAIDNSKGYINGKEYSLDSAPIIHRDRTYLPARFVGEALGYTISWDQYTPAVLVTSNENMGELTKILDGLNSAMNKVTSYEVSTVKTSNIETVYNGETRRSNYKTKNIEKADLKAQVVYTENTHEEDSEKSINYLYNTKDGFYGRYEYVDKFGDKIDTGWRRYTYASGDQETPFESKEKLALINVDKNVYGCLLYKETRDSYIVTSTSNQLDVLKSLNGNTLFNEIFEGKVENLYFELEIDKDTNLPVQLTVSADKINEMTKAQDGFDFYNAENIEYVVQFLSYNKKLNLEVPNVI